MAVNRKSDFRGKEARKKPQSYSNLKKSGVRAGKSKSDFSVRSAQNKGVKDGTIRLGKSGKSYNVYDAKTATWKRGVVKTTTASRPTTRVSPSARGEGSSGKSPAQTAIRNLSGYVGRGMGKAGAQSVKRSTGRSTLRGALSAKRSIDTRNQNRNAAAIASIPLMAAGGAAGAGLGAIARAGTAAAAGARSGIAAGAGLAGRAGTKSVAAGRATAAAKAARTRAAKKTAAAKKNTKRGK